MKTPPPRSAVLAAQALALAVLGYGVAFGISRRTEGAPKEGKAVAASEAALPADAAPPADGSAFTRARSELAGMERKLAAKDFRSLVRSPLSGQDPSAVMREWAEHDAAGAWAWYQGAGPAVLGYLSPITMIFGEWFKQSPEEAIKALGEMDPSQRFEAANGILRLLFGPDEAMSQKVADHLDELVNGGNFGELSFGRRVGSDTMERVEGLPDSPARERIRAQVAAEWFRNDWKAASAWLAALPEEERQGLLPKMAEGAVPLGYPDPRPTPDPAAAGKAEWLRAQLEAPENSGLRVRFGDAYVRQLAATDPGAALAWASEHLGGLTRANAVGALIGQAAGKDLTSAAAMVGDLPPGRVRGSAAGTLLRSWVARDATAALSWARAEMGDGNEIPSGDWMQIGSTLGSSNAEAAREALAGNAREFPASFERAALFDMVRADPEGTLRWATALRGERAGALFGDVAVEFARSDPAKAAAFLTGAEAPPGVPAANYGGVATRWFKREPDAAMQWIATLPPDVRANASEGVSLHIESYFKNDPRAAGWRETLR